KAFSSRLIPEFRNPAQLNSSRVTWQRRTSRRMNKLSKFSLAIAATLLLLLVGNAQTPVPASQPQAMLTQYCTTCHNQTAKMGGLALDQFDVANVGKDAHVWEKVVRKIRSGMMPPSGARRPERAALDAFAGELETRLVPLGRAHPLPTV